MLRNQKSRNLDRSSRVDSQSVSASRFPKSGFDLTYRSYNDYQLGRLHISGYHHTMPADKFRGLNRGQFQFNRLVVPTISPIEVSQHNFFIPYRALDVTFEDAFAPSKLNSMSVDWCAPSFTLNDLCFKLFEDINLVFDRNSNRVNVLEFYQIENVLIKLRPSFESFYLLDIYNELYNNFTNYSDLFPSGTSADVIDYMLYLYDNLFRYFVGEGSLLDSLGYPIIRRVDFSTYRNIHGIFRNYDVIAFGNTTNLSVVPLNEYPIRAYYAIWYEYYRDVNLEPVSNELPKYRQFGSESVVMDYPAMLITRPRCWQHDLHVSTMPDDPFRHVFAPVLNSDTGEIINGNIQTVQRGSINSLNAEYPIQGNGDGDDNFINSNLIRSERVTWLDPSDGTSKSLDLPIPALVSDAISALDDGRNFLASRLDLQTLRRAQALERVLKRNFYFGDEYKDRMLAHYGSVVSDDRVNRPAVLSASVTTINTQEQIASVGTSETPQGTRNLSATAGTDDDGYTFFSEEFGIVLNIISFMPIAQYNGVCPQLLQYKVNDFPLPEYSTQFSEASRVLEVASSCLGSYDNSVGVLQLFGHQPYAHAYRGRVDEVHGSYLSTKSNYTFRRFFGMDEESNTIPKLNYLFVHCNPSLDMFANHVRFDGQLYGYVDHIFTVERCLPTPTEEI